MIWDEIKISLEEGECFDKKQIALASNLNLTNIGVKTRNLIVLKRTVMPAILVEYLFAYSNKREYKCKM